MDIKYEIKHTFTLCHGCLSGDRKLTAVHGQNHALFLKIRLDENSVKHGELQLCWECIAILEKLRAFQLRIQTAQNVMMLCLQSLYDKNNPPPSISTLKPIQNNEYNYTFNYDDPKPTEPLLEDLKLPTIKEEHDSIKEEYDMDNDTLFYEPELKIETDFEAEDTKKLKKKKKESQKNRPPLKVYEQFATVTRKDDIDLNEIDLSECSVVVGLSEREIEEVLVRDRKGRSLDRMPLKCKECKIGYKRRLDLLRHKSFHHNTTPFPRSCEACKTIINTDIELVDHWKDHHTTMIKCTLCSELCRSQRELKKHIRWAHSKLYTCNTCGSEFGTMREFSEHYRYTHEVLICDHCNEKFMTKKKLEIHIRSIHLPKFCKICQRKFKSYKVYDTHMKMYHPEVVAYVTNKELCYCVECDIQFTSSYLYSRHLRQSVKHRPKKKIKVPCPDCGKVFTRMNYMTNHYRLYHTKDSKHHCAICNKYFANGWGVRKHMLHVHQKVALPKNKFCDLCGRGFSSNKILDNHRRTHTGERPFKCIYCPASFAQMVAMKSHQRTQHKH